MFSLGLEFRVWVSEVLGIHSDYFSSFCCPFCLFFRVFVVVVVVFVVLLLLFCFVFDVEVMGVTSRCLASRDNLIFLYVGTS